MEYEYKIHERTQFPKQFNRHQKPCSAAETDELLRSIEQCLDKADQLDFKIVGLKLNEAREALKADQIDGQSIGDATEPYQEKYFATITGKFLENIRSIAATISK